MIAFPSHLLVLVQVNYGNSLRRFNAAVDENAQLELDMDGLRAKILSLFSFPPDADLTLTYIDEDGDVVTLVDDDDLRDAMKQQLKFLRIDVVLNNDKGGRFSARTSGNSTPLRSPRVPPLPNINSAATPEVLKSLPEPLREVLSMSLNLASKATSSSPVFSELVDCLSKMVLQENPDLKSQLGGDTQATASETPVVQPVPLGSNVAKEGDRPEVSVKPTSLEPNSKMNQEADSQNVTGGVGTKVTPATATVDLNFPPGESNPFRHPAQKCTGDNGKAVKQVKAHDFGKCVDGSSSSSSVPQKTSVDKSKTTSVYNNAFNECPFLGLPHLSDQTVPPSTARRVHPFKRNYTDAMGGIFHRGVRCDGCGVHPITGPRFKSKV